MKLRKTLVVLSCLLLAVGSRADEGMWMLGDLNKETRRTMKELGLELSAKQLYHPRRPSLKDAVVSFGGFCSGVVVSREGLVLTNHHCGFSSIRQRSTMEHNYLRDGFVAHNRDEEIPCPELFVRFLIRQENVTRRVLSAVKPGMDEAERSLAIDSVMWTIGREVMMRDSTTVGAVDAYYGGNEFWLSVYRDYYDVRLVFAPPSSVGKFGWEEDNWEWPRHTGDFSVFRIYANQENLPAEYSADNVPYRPAYVAPISLDGYREGSFCMTLGYPGTTERYLSSFGIEEMMQGVNQAQIDVRGVKQAIWKREMDRNDSIRLMYASKYDESSNYWKNSIGMNQAIRRLHVLDKKKAMEKELCRWIENTPRERKRLSTLFTDLETNYRERREVDRANAYFTESFFNGPELVQLALSILNFDFEGERDAVVAGLENIVEQYANLDVDIDKEVFASMIDVYRARVDSAYWPVFFQEIDTLYGGSSRAYADTLYARSDLTSPRGLKRFLERDTTYHIYEDPAITLSIDLLAQLFEMNYQVREPSREIRRGERLLNAAVRRMYDERNFYPDANSTLRLSFGTVCGYRPQDGVEYNHYTTVRGILEKVKSHAGNADFALQPDLLKLFLSGQFGRYADQDGQMKVCFISNNDITGGNSGSAMFNERGELLGLAFDGNWEAMSGDICYEPQLQRTIGVDIRYVLFIIEKYAHASHLVHELLLSD
ncbi:MAG TPA: S46 family peptidase [Candidatus Bacteroides merdipullorum]|uniref:Dipeptidyl-peptidase n=1 Tax=Candidatus Bacteroides merdipullorum TaxID=2838474 RepID=A0A9D2A4M6_9BACE|nr:S46 family peptidase [Candidatus Bacteroides merdipullorum]